MRYQVSLRRAARKQLDLLVGQSYQVVATSISALESDPRPPGVKKLAASGLWRIKVGRFRIVYGIDDGEGVVTVVRIARRSEQTYRRL